MKINFFFVGILIFISSCNLDSIFNVNEVNEKSYQNIKLKVKGVVTRDISGQPISDVLVVLSYQEDIWSSPLWTETDITDNQGNYYIEHDFGGMSCRTTYAICIVTIKDGYSPGLSCDVKCGSTVQRVDITMHRQD